MDVTEISWSDATAVRRYADVVNAARRLDAPWEHPRTVPELVGELRWGWDGEPPALLVATAGGVDVAVAEYEASTYDNQHLAWLDVQVAPGHRRQGHGSELLQLLVARARSEGRRTVGIGGWDHQPAAAAFADRHGFTQGSVEIRRRQALASLDRAALDALHADSLPHAADYDLVRWPRRTPPADLPAIAELTTAINDAPQDDLDYEDEVFTPERIAAYEHATEAKGGRMRRVVARHRGTGELAGQSAVVVDGERPHLAEQHDTSVARAHRGHRLGVLLKLEVMRLLAEEEPQVQEVNTWNAESNDHMIEVNEVLGYRVMGRMVDYQRPVG